MSDNNTHVDSTIVEHHDDGSYTVTSVETFTPLTNRQKAAGWAAVGVLGLLPVAPLLAVAALEKFEEKRDARRIRKANQAESTD